HVQRGTHVQTACIDVAKHAVLQTVGVEQGAELANIRGQVCRVDGSIFNERNRAPRPGGVAEEADALLAQVPEGGRVRLAVAHSKPESACKARSALVQTGGEFG